MFSHRVECAVLDSMHTGSLKSALKQILLSHGWSTKELSLDSGSSLVPAAENRIEELQQLGEAEEDDDTENQEREDNLDPAIAVEVMDNLRQSGFKIRPPRAKASYKQSTVESTIKSLKKVLKASLLPTIEGMTATSFTRAVKMSASTINLRPVILLPPGASHPGELTCVLPQALRGPDYVQWLATGYSQQYSAQLAIVARQQEAFKRAWRTHYTRRLRRLYNMVESNATFQIGDVDQ